MSRSGHRFANQKEARSEGVTEGVPVVELGRDEIAREIEAGAQERLGMSAGQLVDAYRKGTLEDPSDVADLLVLSDLLADDDPLLSE
jgi:hypothetical protein